MWFLIVLCRKEPPKEDISDPRDIKSILVKIPLKAKLKSIQVEGLEFMWRLLMPKVMSVDKSRKVDKTTFIDDATQMIRGERKTSPKLCVTNL